MAWFPDDNGQRRIVMAIELSNVDKPKSKMEPFLPALIAFGPIFLLNGLSNMVDMIGLHNSFHSPMSGINWRGRGEATAGAFMLVIGLVVLKLRQDNIEKRLNELERLRD
jgi:hypothetical protein